MNPTIPSLHFTLGLDLGQANDFTALAIIERYGEVVQPSFRVQPVWEFREYRLRHIYRFPLFRSYPEIARHVVALQQRPELRGACELVVDYTGVGRAVCDVLAEAGAARMTRVAITGGIGANVVSYDEVRLPKRELVSTLHKHFHAGTLRTNPNLPFQDVLAQEIAAFSMKVTATGHDQYEALRSSDHDDLVLAIALALWQAERRAKAFEPQTLSVPI